MAVLWFLLCVKMSKISFEVSYKMTFQTFFFDTYAGYFLQILPVCLTVGILYWILILKKEKRSAVRVFFVMFLTGLVSLTLFLNTYNEIYYRLFYHRANQRFSSIFSFDWSGYFQVDFYKHLNRERRMNLLVYIPYGILACLSQKKTDYALVICSGFLCSLLIECIQPFVNRAFDINDVLLNTAGAILGVFIVILGRKIRGVIQRIV